MPAIRIMIVENDPALLKVLTTVLTGHLELEIVSALSSREAAIKQISSAPAVMVLNPAVLKDHTLSRFLRSVHLKSPHTRVVLFLVKTLPDEVLISDIRTGVRGYIRSTDAPETIIKAIRSVCEGTIWAERRILEKAISRPMILPETLHARVPGLTPLTNREVEMLTMVLQGASNREIAYKNSISERTVKTHLYRVYRKLNVNSRTKAIALLSHSQGVS